MIVRNGCRNTSERSKVYVYVDLKSEGQKIGIVLYSHDPKSG